MAEEPIDGKDEIFWHYHAEEAQEVAETSKTLPAKHNMLVIAAVYARLAKYARKRTAPNTNTPVRSTKAPQRRLDR
jgi:hypothetical protein